MARQGFPNPHSPDAAIWPPNFVPTSPRRLGSLPRIDSASAGLDKLDLSAGGGSSSGAPSVSLSDPEKPPSAAPPPATIAEMIGISQSSGVVDHTSGAAAEAPASGAPAPSRTVYNVGDRVEVDFDDEGWFSGAVESSKEQGGVYIYSVALDMGELAEDVVGSEIRTQGNNGDAGSQGGSSERIAHTRSDNLSAFDVLSEVDVTDGDAPAAAAEEESTMQCRVTASNEVEWSFINEKELSWSPPTAALLRAHTEAQASSGPMT